jgi:carbonic anhydrase
MTELNKILAANEEYSEDFRHGELSHMPSRKIAILACMDARLTGPYHKKRWRNSYR